MLNADAQLIFAKIETTAGTDATPTTTDAMLVRNIQHGPVQGDRIARNLDRGYAGAQNGVVTALHQTLSFEIELAGSGTAGTAPAYDAILKCCGLGSATVTASTKVDYNLVDLPATPTASIYRYIKEASSGGSGSTLYKLLGFRGNTEFALDPKGIPILKVSGIGSYVAASSVAMPTGINFSAFRDPLATSRANTPTVSFFGAAHCVDAFSLDLGNQVVWRELYNCNGSHITQRMAKGSFTVEARSAAVKNWAADFAAGTTGALSYVHGTTAGNIIELACPRIQISSAPTESRKDGLIMLQIPFDVIPTAANNELVLTVR